jgi:uncharacterized iron-regulated membrane protein
MKTKSIRNLTFHLHRALGLILGAIISLVGLTGSLLVFESEIDSWADSQRFGNVTPMGKMLSLDRAVEIAQVNYPERQIQAIDFPSDNRHPLKIQMFSKNNPDDWYQVLINPYTQKIMGDRSHIDRLTGWAFDLHLSLMAGEWGNLLVGIASGLLAILSLTGVMLWPGWRKLAAGFKIKWNAHLKRLNFDLHKVVGITMATFISLAALTGFCWTFNDWTFPAIYALTFSPPSEDNTIKLTPQPGQAIASTDLIVQKAQQALPEIKAISLGFPETQTDPFAVFGKAGEAIYINPYTAQVLKIKSHTQRMSLGDRITGSFGALHFGTFAGVYSRILYVFVGLAPSVLFITGLVMWWQRKPIKSTNQKNYV